jgi:hypothetical protein
MIPSHLPTKQEKKVSGPAGARLLRQGRPAGSALTVDEEGLISLAVMWLGAEEVRRTFRKEKRMNTTRILVLTVGIFSAITITGMKSRVLANLRPSLHTTAQSNDEINDKNWTTNPKIVAIRKIVNSDNAAVRKGTFKTEHRICEEGWFSRLRIARDSKGIVRWYQHYQEGEDSSWDDNYYYDDAGRLRFVLMTSYAINGTREQHRAYFDESGDLIYHGRHLLKGPGYFGPPVEDLKETVKMDPKKDFAEATQGCKEVKSSAKRRVKKN